MTGRTARTALRTARTGRGWSQSEASAELRALSLRRGGPDTSAASLKTQLSRWENGHAVPDSASRALLTELYGRTADELGLLPPEPHGGHGADRLRAALAAASAVDSGTLRLWGEQLALVRRLDDELGAAGSHGLVGALVDQLTRALDHTVTGPERVALARLLCPAAVLAGAQALDRGDPESAWRHLGVARAAAVESGSATDLAFAIAGRCEVLGEIGMAGAALDLLGGTGPLDVPAARIRLAAARAAGHAAVGNAHDALRALDEADRTHPLVDIPPVVDAVHRPDGPVIELVDLHRWRGHTLATLDDPTALLPLQSALAAHPRSARHRASVHADLARTLATAGRSADSEAHARAARGLAMRIGSVRVTSRLDDRPAGGPR